MLEEEIARSAPKILSLMGGLKGPMSGRFVSICAYRNYREVNTFVSKASKSPAGARIQTNA